MLHHHLLIYLRLHLLTHILAAPAKLQPHAYEISGYNNAYSQTHLIHQKAQAMPEIYRSRNTFDHLKIAALNNANLHEHIVSAHHQGRQPKQHISNQHTQLMPQPQPVLAHQLNQYQNPGHTYIQEPYLTTGRHCDAYNPGNQQSQATFDRYQKGDFPPRAPALSVDAWGVWLASQEYNGYSSQDQDSCTAPNPHPQAAPGPCTEAAFDQYPPAASSQYQGAEFTSRDVASLLDSSVTNEGYPFVCDYTQRDYTTFNHHVLHRDFQYGFPPQALAHSAHDTEMRMGTAPNAGPNNIAPPYTNRPPNKATTVPLRIETLSDPPAAMNEAIRDLSQVSHNCVEPQSHPSCGSQHMQQSNAGAIGSTGGSGEDKVRLQNDETSQSFTMYTQVLQSIIHIKTSRKISRKSSFVLISRSHHLTLVSSYNILGSESTHGKDEMSSV